MQNSIRQLERHASEIETTNEELLSSIRILNHSKEELEEQLYSAEESVIMYKEELEEYLSLHDSQMHSKKPDESINISASLDPAERFKVIANLQPLSSAAPACLHTTGEVVVLQSDSSTTAYRFDSVYPEAQLSEYWASQCLQQACTIVYSEDTSALKPVMYQAFQQLAHVQHITFNCVEVLNDPAQNWRELAQVSSAKNWVEDALELVRPRPTHSHLVYTLWYTANGMPGHLQFVQLAPRIEKPVGHALKINLQINKSLTALVDVLVALASRRKHIPYRNSQLTELLKPSLGHPECLCTVVVSLDTRRSHCKYTKTALAFSKRVKRSSPSLEVSQVSCATSMKDTRIHQLVQKVTQLKREKNATVLAIKAKDNKMTETVLAAQKKVQELNREVKMLRSQLTASNKENEVAFRRLRVLGSKHAKLMGREALSRLYISRPPSVMLNLPSFESNCPTPRRSTKPRFTVAY